MNPVLKKTSYFIIGMVIYLYLSYQIISFLLQYLPKTPHLQSVIMSVYKGPTVTLSGNIVFQDYKKGYIEIMVLAKKPEEIIRRLDQFIIALERIPKPGLYKIKVPKKMGEVYIIASNFDTNLDIQNVPNIPMPKSPPAFGRGKYVKYPLNVGDEDINGLDIEIKTVKNIPTQMQLK